MDDLGRRKLRDVTDFEWKRNMRFYGNIREKGSKFNLAYNRFLNEFTYISNKNSIKNDNDNQGKLRLNLHTFRVSVMSALLEYGR